MQENDKISIIIPVYNLEKYIEKTVQSVLEQTYKNIEIVIVNDGSTDMTMKILDKLSLSDERIKVLHKRNEGVTKARLTGVSAAIGNWVGFVDGDDVIESDMYERLLENAYRYQAEISHCGYQMVFPNRIDYYYDTGQVVLQDNEKGLTDLLEGAFIEPGLCNKLYHKTLFQNLLCEDVVDMSIKNNEDLLMNYYLFKNSNSSVYEDWCPYHYILRLNSATTSSLNENQLKDPLKVLQIIRSDLTERNLIKIVESRILLKLISVATMSRKYQEKFAKDYIIWARNELKIALNKIDRSLINNRILVMAKSAYWCPWIYAIVHKIYAILKGTDKKYEIRQEE